MSENQELKPCPFCGSGNTRIIHPSNRYSPYVMCLDCTGAGPQKAGQAAIDGWNRRSHPLPPKDTPKASDMESSI